MLRMCDVYLLYCSEYDVMKAKIMCDMLQKTMALESNKHAYIQGYTYVIMSYIR